MGKGLWGAEKLELSGTRGSTGDKGAAGLWLLVEGETRKRGGDAVGAAECE